MATDHFKTIFDALVDIVKADSEARVFSVHGGEHHSKRSYPVILLVPATKRYIREGGPTGRRRKLPIQAWYDFDWYIFVDRRGEEERALGSKGITQHFAIVETMLKKDANRKVGGACLETDWSDPDFDTIDGKVDMCLFTFSCRRTETE